jgi:uncharacterized protein YcfJ
MNKLILIVLSSRVLFGAGTTVMVPVFDSKPIYREVTSYRHDSSICTREVRRNNYSNHSNSGRGSNIVGDIVKTTISLGGAYAGHQGASKNIGKGTGSDVAGALGAVLGYKLGGKVGDVIVNPNHRSNYDNTQTVIEEYKCNKRVPVRKTIVNGYTNYFNINGNTYKKITKQPQNEIKVRINYSW